MGVVVGALFWMGLCIGAAFATPLRTVPVWPPQIVQQLEAYRIEVVVTHKATNQVTILIYHETFPDTRTATGMVPVVQGLFFEWLKANYDMDEPAFHGEFILEIRIVKVVDGAAVRRAT